MSRAETLRTYVLSLPDFTFTTDNTARYHHIGATLAEACLQAGISWSVVKKRVDHIRETRPSAATLSGLREILAETDVETLLQWKAGPKPNAFRAAVEMLEAEGIDNEDDLRAWLEVAENRARLGTVKGFGGKTVDYLCRLVGMDAAMVDRYVYRFLDNAGVTYSGYEDARLVVEETARLFGQPLAAMDYSIWLYASSKK